MAISIKASPEGLSRADSARKIKGWTKTSQRCCDAAHTSAATLKRFWQGAHIRRETFISICEALDLKWQDIALEAEPSEAQLTSPSEKSDNDIDTLIQRTWKNISFRFESGNSINQQQHLQWIQENFIDLDLIKVTFLPSEYPVEDTSLIKKEISSEHSFDRLGIKLLQGQTTNSRDVLDEFDNIFIYGEPGSGKSTYLKWIALKSRAGELLIRKKAYIPVFIEIRSFAAISRNTSLLEFIETIFDEWGLSPKELENLQQVGRFIFIFDGFDETPTHEWNYISNEIEEVLIKYDNCRFVCSSRLATNFPFFSGFQKIIVAPFEPKKHIPKFIEQWFNQPDKEPEMAQAMIEKIKHRQYQGIREIAQRPILLKMLCIIFEYEKDFPTRRADVFRTGIEKMMSSTHEVELHIAQTIKLKNHHINNILQLIASHFFIKEDFTLLFPIRTVENIIRAYLSQVFGVERYEIPADEILNGIEQSSGLIIRWAKNLCSFSHLTYQEFFVADDLVQNDQYKNVYEYLKKPHWDFVIGIVSELVPSEAALDFLADMKEAVDGFIKEDSKILQHLENINQVAKKTTQSLDHPEQDAQTYIRAWYFTYSIKHPGKTTNIGYRKKYFDIPELEMAINLPFQSQLLEGHELIYQAYHRLCQDYYSGKLDNLVKQIKKFFDKQPKSIDDNFNRVSSVMDGWLQVLELEPLKFDNYHAWWSAKKGKWGERVITLMKNLGLPHTSNLTQEQKEQLLDYYRSTKLLSTCMNRSQLDPKYFTQIASLMLVIKPIPIEEFGGFDDFASTR